MHPARSTQSIETAWREILDASLETGESPVYTIDPAAGSLDGMRGVLALTLLDAQRHDLAAPLLAVGGAGPLWLAALWHVRPANAPPRTPPVVTAYTAPDAATHLAALTTWDTRRSAFYQRPHRLPPWAQPDAAPEANPATTAYWSTSPLARFSRMTDQDGWLAWTGIVAAIALLIIAALA